MMAYGYDIHFDERNFDNNSLSLIEIDNICLNDFNNKLRFENNQNREVYLLSKFSIDSNDTTQEYVFNIKNLLSFKWGKKSNTIFYKFHAIKENRLLKYWTLHTLLPLYFTIENIYYFLHAGAIEIGNKPILFVADSYGGKSTMTEFFMKKGHTMLSDDKVATYRKDEKVYATPSYSYHRPYRNTEDLGYQVENFAIKPRPICSIYNLIKSESTSKIDISKVTGVEKFKALKYSTDVEMDIHKNSRFSSLANIANKIDVYNITIPWDKTRLDEVYETIIEHTKG